VSRVVVGLAQSTGADACAMPTAAVLPSVVPEVVPARRSTVSEVDRPGKPPTDLTQSANSNLPTNVAAVISPRQHIAVCLTRTHIQQRLESC
jgi:hypothetical protein